MAIAEYSRELLLIEQHCLPQPDGSIIAGPFKFLWRTFVAGVQRGSVRRGRR